ncbi:MAG: glutathione S-transferase family protein [Cyanobacteria bacterium P01_D01_bin.44]
MDHATPKLYGHELSGNVYKVRLLLSLLGVEPEVVRVDLMKGEHKTPDFLAINPFGQVPVLVDGETTLADAQAILVYLARRYGSEDWLPSEPEALARVVRWLSTAAGEVRQGPETARLYYRFGVKSIDIELATQKAGQILQLLENHSNDRHWLELDRPTIADIAIFPYVALAPDGQISLAPYPNISAWIERIKALPGFVGMAGIEAPVTV